MIVKTFTAVTLGLGNLEQNLLQNFLFSLDANKSIEKGPNCLVISLNTVSFNSHSVSMLTIRDA